MAKVTLIIGAGANKEIHPEIDLGSELIENISNRVTDHNVVHKNLSNLLNKLKISSSLREEFKFHLDRYRKSVPNPSIDAFLYEVSVFPEFDHHRQEFLRIGKILIVSHVRGYEGTQSMVNIDNEISSYKKSGHGNMWLSYLGQYIETHDVLRAKELNIVTFNYDRLLEYYLERRFDSRDDDFCKVRNAFIKDNIIHVYGNLGGENSFLTSLELGNDRPEIEEKYAPNIKLSTDRGSDKRIENAVLGADKVLVMGYGLDPLNNRRLQLQRITLKQELIFNGHPGAGYDFAPRRNMADTVRDLVVDAEICHYSSCKEFIVKKLLNQTT